MRLVINPRGNGACLLCSASGDCRIQRLMTAGVEKIGSDSDLEIVIYTCPYFVEREEA
jgi:hypothetical protein